MFVCKSCDDYLRQGSVLSAGSNKNKMNRETTPEKENFTPVRVEKSAWEEKKFLAYELLTKVVSEENFHLVEITDVRNSDDDILMSGVIWSPNGVGISDLVKISKKFIKHLEENLGLVTSGISEILRLDLSSPGINRTLKNLDELSIFINMNVQITLSHSINNQKRLKGENLGLDDNQVKLKVDDKVILIDTETVSKVELVG
ncbi:MAG: hypothetical protein KAH30_02655 [Caldisericia bacterium]|nr:hypothetical protein [Caldisericia bacterium]